MQTFLKAVGFWGAFKSLLELWASVILVDVNKTWLVSSSWTLSSIQCTDLRHQFRSSYHIFLADISAKRKYFKQIFILIQTNAACKQLMKTTELKQSYFTNTLNKFSEINFKLVSYFDSTVINNQIKHEVTTNGWNFM